MHKDLLTQSPLLILPLTAMFLFLAVWVAALVRAMTRSRAEMDAAARLPLEETWEFERGWVDVVPVAAPTRGGEKS